MQAYCPECERERKVDRVRREETYPVKGEPITIDANVLVCSICGTDIFNEALDSRNLVLAYSKYRKEKGLLDVDDITMIRKKYGLSQRGIATLLGWSPATISRYEAGAIPSIAHNEQLCHFYEDVSYARSLFDTSKGELGRLDRKRMEEVLGLLRPTDTLQDYLVQYISKLYSSYGSLLRGDRAFDLDRLASMIVFFSVRCNGVVKSKLLKLLWYSDFLSYRRTLRSISGTVYCHNHFGPIPLAHDVIIEFMVTKGLIDLRPYEGPYEGECVEPLVEFNSSRFDEEELGVLEDVLETFKNCTATRLSEMTHEEDGYIKTVLKDPISYEYAMALKAIS